MKLRKFQLCLMFMPKQVAHLQSVMTAAKSASVAIHIENSEISAQLDKHGQLITNADRNDMYCACMMAPHRLAGLLGHVIGQ